MAMLTSPSLHAFLAEGVFVAFLFFASPMEAQPREFCKPGTEVAAAVVGVGGHVTVTPRSGDEMLLTVGSVLCYGDRIVTGEDANVEFRFGNANTTTGASSNTIVLLPPSPEAGYNLTVVSGLIRFISSVRDYFEIQSPLVNAGIDGTEAMVVVDGTAADTLVLVREGKITAIDRRSPAVRVALAGGEAAYASNGTTLVAATPETVPDKFLPFLLHPEDAADWAVYYPPFLLGADVVSARVREAAEQLGAGKPDAAEALLADVPLAPRDRAAALAIRSMAAVFRNQTAAGLELAEAAVAAHPGLGAAHIALSYALQAEGVVEAARDAAADAVAVAPGDAYAWARLAELELTLGDYRRTALALERSLALRETALARAIEGFLALANTRVERAETAFARAIALDSNAPLPRLGLGLTKIRRGHLADGRAEIETAVALDPRRASLRTWLGRVYFEENRPEKAAAQFELAEEEDPDDPTPHFFSALERFAANDPIGALADIEQAQRLGEQRGTLRGEPGLAEDRAARGAALGRVYDLLGFEPLATVVGSRAVEDDPTSPEAHFFLSDAFLGRQGFEVAQSSEFMLGQILSPPNRALIQPRLAETDLALLHSTGPTRATFVEFSPLITGNGASLGLAGGAGTQDSYGVEASAAVLQGPVSLAVGQFYSTTDGFLPNNFVNHEIYALEGRAQLGPQLNLFAEFRHRDSEWGDRVIGFGNEISPNERNDLKRDNVRAALHYEAAPGHSLVVVGTWADLDAGVENCEALSLPPRPELSVKSRLDASLGGYNLEARYFGRFGRTRATVGGSFARVDVDETQRFVELGDCASGAPVTRRVDFPLTYTIESQGAFAYLTSEALNGVEATLGLSFGDFEQSGYSASEIDPKFGLRVKLNEAVELRAAYAETMARPLILDQTVEPTTIAGFNQFYDDINGAAAEFAGVGVDVRARPNLWIGAAGTRRWLDTPRGVTDDSFTIVETRETTIGGYASATLGDHWALSLEARHEMFQLKGEGLNLLPHKVNTTSVPLSLRWFDENGLFTSVDAVYVHQTLTESPGAPQRDEHGVLLGGSVGYRLENGRGVIALEGGNLLDQNLEIRDPTFVTTRPQGPLYARDFAIFLTGTFVW
jgi:tetratricopeptide (TPR) repeat protein